MWSFGFWGPSHPPISGGYPYLFSPVDTGRANNFGLQVKLDRAIVAGGGSSEIYSPLQSNTWYFIAYTSSGVNDVSVFINGLDVATGNFFTSGSVNQITLNNYGMNTSTANSFNSNFNIASMGLTDTILSISDMNSMKASLETKFGNI